MWSVVKNVAQMAIAPCTSHLRAGAKQTFISMGCNRVRFDFLEKRRPAAARMKLMRCIVEMGSTADAVIGAGGFVVEIGSSLRSFSCCVAQDLEFERREDGLPVFVRQGGGINSWIERGVGDLHVAMLARRWPLSTSMACSDCEAASRKYRC